MKDSTKKFILTNAGLPFHCPVTSPAGINLIAAIPVLTRVGTETHGLKTLARKRCAAWVAEHWRTVEPILSRRFPRSS